MSNTRCTTNSEGNMRGVNSKSNYKLEWDRARAGKAMGRGDRYKLWAMRNVARVEYDLGLVGKLDKKSRKKVEWQLGVEWGRACEKAKCEILNKYYMRASEDIGLEDQGFVLGLGDEKGEKQEGCIRWMASNQRGIKGFGEKSELWSFACNVEVDVLGVSDTRVWDMGGDGKPKGAGDSRREGVMHGAKAWGGRKCRGHGSMVQLTRGAARWGVCVCWHMRA